MILSTLLDAQQEADQLAAEYPIEVAKIKIYVDAEGQYRTIITGFDDLWIKPKDWKILASKRPGGDWMILVKGFEW